MHLVRGGAEIQLVAKPKSKLVRVAFNRLLHCPKEISNATDSESEQAQSEKLSRKSISTADNVSTDDDLVVEDCKSCVPVEEPVASESAEESTVVLPNKVSTTDVRVEQSTSSNDETTGGEGNRWKHRIRPRGGKRDRRGRAPKGRGHVIDCY